MTETDAFSSGSDLGLAVRYPMNKKQRGLALIFNQEEFHWELNLGFRRGSSRDRDRLRESLSLRGFEVQCYNNSKKTEVQDIISKAAAADHSDSDCFLLAFMSHGKDKNIYASDAEINVQEITDKFKGTKSLVGKPKIFIWQACRGREFEDPVTACAAGDSDEEMEVDGYALQTLPAGADFIMCYSVTEGFYSIRDPECGSWYIQDLCELLQKCGASIEFTHLLTLVNNKVSVRSIEKCRNRPDAEGKKQMPCFVSMLTKQLYFHPKQS